MFSHFEVIPAVDVQGGEAVQLVGGKRGSETRYGDPVTAARRWVDAGAETLHLVDLDGAFEGARKNAKAIEAIRRTVDVPIQLGGGIRSEKTASDLLDSGIDRVILGTAALESPELVELLAESYPGRVIVSLDAKDGEVVVAGWTEGAGIDPVTAASRYEALGASGILFTDVGVEGQLEGVEADRIEALSSTVDIPIIASGGVATIDDVISIRDAGAAAVVVGTALYEGKFTLEAAMAAI